jgi:hypothetical protein
VTTGKINGHDFEHAPCGTACKHCGLSPWSKATTCVVGLPRCSDCRKPKAQNSADVDSGRFCCNGFGTSRSCLPYGAARIDARHADAAFGEQVRKYLDAITDKERADFLRGLRAENSRMAPVMHSIFAAYVEMQSLR